MYDVTGIYLFVDNRLWECRAAARYLKDYKITAAIIPCVGIDKPELLIGLSKFEGLDEIKYAVDRLCFN